MGTIYVVILKLTCKPACQTIVSPESPDTFRKFAVSLITPSVHIPEWTFIATQEFGSIKVLFVGGALDSESISTVWLNPPFVGNTDGVWFHSYRPPPGIRFLVDCGAHVMIVSTVFDSEAARFIDRLQGPRERVAVDPRSVVNCRWWAKQIILGIGVAFDDNSLLPYEDFDTSRHPTIAYLLHFGSPNPTQSTVVCRRSIQHLFD